MEWLLWEDVFSSATELVKMNMARSALEMIFKKIAADKEYYARVFEVKGQNSFEDMLYHNICNLVHVVVERNSDTYQRRRNHKQKRHFFAV